MVIGLAFFGGGAIVLLSCVILTVVSFTERNRMKLVLG